MNKPEPAFHGNIVVLEAKKYIGLPYKWGATGPNAFDCSGFTQYVYNKAVGIHIPRITYDQIKLGKPISISNLLPGDLIFTLKADHVGIFVSNGQFIHAPYPGQKVKISYIFGFYSARRIL